MSLDLWMESPQCPTCKHTERSDSFNCTYNLAAMWYEIFLTSKHMVHIDGMKGRESLPMLSAAMNELALNPEKFKMLNPSNGFGHYEGFVNFIIDLILTAQKHPDWIWKASR